MICWMGRWIRLIQAWIRSWVSSFSQHPTHALVIVILFLGASLSVVLRFIHHQQSSIAFRFEELADHRRRRIAASMKIMFWKWEAWAETLYSELKIRKSSSDAKTRLHVNYSVAESWHSENISRHAPYSAFYHCCRQLICIQPTDAFYWATSTLVSLCVTRGIARAKMMSSMLRGIHIFSARALSLIQSPTAGLVATTPQPRCICLSTFVLSPFEGPSG